VCGACTINLNGAPARSCITYAVACDGANIRTIEGFDDDPLMAELRSSFSSNHALQCGYCTPGMIMASEALLRENPHPSDQEIRTALGGNICRCTGYVKIIESVHDAAATREA